MVLRKGLALGVAALGIGAAVIVGYSTLPSLEPRTSSSVLSDTDGTRLGKAISPLVSAHPGRAGVYPLRDAGDAFAARARLAERADRSLDVQYYIWRKDCTGTLLFEALHKAADRGVRVRLLMDDNNTSGLDTTLAALDSHSNIEVRLFNPFVIRRPRAFGYLTDFSRLNRRMHNKSFTADNQATIIGGRNVGDEYFGATDGVLFADLDVLAIGPVVNEVSESFDLYWASGSSYPVDRLLPPATSDSLAELAAAASQVEQSPEAADYLSRLRESTFVQELTERRLKLEWAVTHMVSDDPAKGLGLAAPEALLTERLRLCVGEPASRLTLVSPYFVPTAAGVEWLVGLMKRGVEIQILTNSLEATDVAFVHAGYAKRRKPLLKAGIRLYELRRKAKSPGPRETGGLGSSGSSLHAKTFAVDHARVFVGSLNFDPRSARLNTEMGFVIESPAIARRIDDVLRQRVSTDVYEVLLTESGRTYWVERRGTKQLRHDNEPGTTMWKRAWIRFLSMLPIEWLL